MAVALICCQVLLSLVAEGEGPVRFGFPLPVEHLRRGLRAEPPAQLQWRPLQERPDPETGRLWVELAVTGASGQIRVLAGGAGPVGDEGGTVVRVETEAEIVPGGEVKRRRWTWSTGERDVRGRWTFDQQTEHRGEVFDAGESLTETSPDLLGRGLRVRIAARAWERAGVLPPMGTLARDVRGRLIEVASQLRELPGLRGHGDYGRSNDVVTNLEYDTALGLARLGLAAEVPDLLRRALDSARHLADRDLHPRTGLPYRHGPGHRSAQPETGHAWLQGLLLIGCVAADDDLIGAARTIANGLARHPPQGEGRDDRARDYGWPLLELEAWLRFADDTPCRRAADALAANLQARWDARNRVVRFGEGERRRGFYEERLWITGGILLPALRAHVQRRPDRGIEAMIGALEGRLRTLVQQGKAGLPLRYWVCDGVVSGQVRMSGVPETFMVIEGLSPRSLARCLRRAGVARALSDVPTHDDPDVATSFSIAARCSWVLR